MSRPVDGWMNEVGDVWMDRWTGGWKRMRAAASPCLDGLKSKGQCVTLVSLPRPLGSNLIVANRVFSQWLSSMNHCVFSIRGALRLKSSPQLR